LSPRRYWQVGRLVGVEDEVAPVLPVHLRDLLLKLSLEPRDAPPEPLDLVAEREDGLDAGEVEPELGREPLDEPQPLEVALRVEPRVPRRALRPDEPLLLVDPERLRVHADELGGDADHVARAIVAVHQLKSLSRGFPGWAFWSS